LKYPRCIVISDDTYEYLSYGKPIVDFSKLEGMWERTITVSTAGKTFNVTGWKIGWAIGKP